MFQPLRVVKNRTWCNYSYQLFTMAAPPRRVTLILFPAAGRESFSGSDVSLYPRERNLSAR